MAQDIASILKYITQGVYVVSVSDGEVQNAFTAAWVMQVSFDPPLICFSINPKHYSYKILKKGSVCCISVLDNEQFIEANHFGQSSSENKMDGFLWHQTETGAPALAESIAYFDCRVEYFSHAGDHELVVCRIIDAVCLKEGEPMLYVDTYDMDKSSELYKK
jgi:flavin reductase (DIM6/NTAB) family NADH-FMN oxidoreductase RutF